MRMFLILLAVLTLAGCSSRPVYVADVDYPPLAKGVPVQVSFAADQPAPAAKRFAFTIRQIGVGSQSDLNSAIESGTNWAKSIGANAIHIAISEPETRRQKVEVSYYHIPVAAVEPAPGK